MADQNKRKGNADSHSWNPADDIYEQEFNPGKPGGKSEYADDPRQKNIEKVDQAVSKLFDREKEGDFNYTPPKQRTRADGTVREPSRIRRILSNKRALTGLGIGGGITTLLFSSFVAFLPLKLELLIKAVSQEVMEIPQDAVEKRLQYLLSTYIAHKVLGVANPADTYPGTPVQSLFKTWQSSKMQERLGIKIESNRTNNGQTATKWKVTFTNGEVIEGGNDNFSQISHKINSTAEMKRFLKNEFKQASKHDKALWRLGGRKSMMRTAGVTRWAWLPDPALDKIDSWNEKKLALRKEFRKKTYEPVKRALGRVGFHIACLTDYQSCRDLKNKRYSTELDDPPAESANIDCPEGDAGADCRANRDAVGEKSAAEIDEMNDAVDKELDGIIEGDGGSDNASSKQISKIISKQLLSKIAAGVGIVDTVARIVNGIDNGALNQVIYDRNTVAYVGYGAEFLSSADQMKLGELTFDQFNILAEILENYGASPTFQALTGQIDPSGKYYERDCGADAEPTVLPKGQTNCPERMIITDKTSFTSAAWWQPISKFADLYLNSVGRIFDLFNGFLGLVGFNAVMEKLFTLIPGFAKEAIEKAFANVLELVIGVAVSGDDTGKEAGDNIAGGITGAAFKLGETSLDTDEEGVPNGTGLGIGGEIMTPSQVAAAEERIAAEDADARAHRSVFAQIFDTEDTHSFVSQMAMRVPTSTGEIKGIGNMISSSIASIFAPKSRAAATANPFFSVNIMYGYTKTSELEADPKQYTAEKCAELEKQREESYKSPSETNHQFPILVYTKSNPCALEKTVAAVGEASFTGDYPKDFRLENDNVAAGGGAAESGENPSEKGYVWPITKGDYKPLSNCFRKPGHTGIDIPVSNKPVHAAADGKVVTTDPSGRSDGGKYIVIKHNDGHWTNYQHLSSISVNENDDVKAGQRIGTSGNTGFSTGPHLHFSVTEQAGLDSRKNVSYSVNPIPFLPKDRSLGVCG